MTVSRGEDRVGPNPRSMLSANDAPDKKSKNPPWNNRVWCVRVVPSNM